MPGQINNVPIIEYPSNPEQLFRDKTIWEWESGVTESPEEDTFTAEDSTAYAQGWLKDGTYLTDLLAYFIGYSYVDQNDPFLQLNRKLPAFHPRWPWLYVSRVQIKGVKMQGQDEEANGGVGLPLPLYDRYRFRVYADGLPYAIRSDEDIDTDGSGEWGRYLFIDSEDTSELFVQEGGAYRYINSLNPLAPPNPGTFIGPQTGTPILAAGMRVYAQRTLLVVTSYQVAHDLVLDAWGVPRKFMIAKNKVNSATFLGRPPETMLLKNWSIKKTPQPVATQDRGTLSYGLRITMKFNYTNPPPFDATIHRGWNLAPGFNVNSFAGWLYVEQPAMGAIPAKALYDSVDFNELLTHQSLTTGGFTDPP